MSTRTNQQIFDHVLAYITQQGSPAIGPDRQCLYITPDGKRCGVGCLMRDDPKSRAAAAKFITAASFLLGDQSCENPHLGFRQLFDFEILPEQLELLQDIQLAHDRGVMSHHTGPAYVKEFHEQMQQVAISHNLRFILPPKG